MFKRRIFILIVILIFLTGCTCTYEKDYDLHFGINGGYYSEDGEGFIQAMTEELMELGNIWLRHPGKGFTWPEVEPANDQWDFERTDLIINDHPLPLVIEVYGQIGAAYPFSGNFTTQFFQTLESENAIMNYIQEHEVNMSNPQQREDAEDYVKTFVKRYKDEIIYWQISNEGLQAPGKLELIKYTYTWIKEVHPDSIVLVTSVIGDTDDDYYDGIETMNEMLSDDLGNYFDIANFHYYGRTGDDLEERLEKAYDAYEGVLLKYGINKPIWVTETATSSVEDSVISGESSEKIQARDVVKRMVIFSAKGAEKVFWNDYRETFENNKFYGCNLVDSDTREPKPSYYTFKLVIDKLGYYNEVETLSNEELWVYKFTFDDKSPIYVAWSNEDEVIDLSEESGTMKVTHIVEDDNNEPVTEYLAASAIPLTESPVFIEASL